MLEPGPRSREIEIFVSLSLALSLRHPWVVFASVNVAKYPSKEIPRRMSRAVTDSMLDFVMLFSSLVNWNASLILVSPSDTVAPSINAKSNLSPPRTQLVKKRLKSLCWWELAFYR